MSMIPGWNSVAGSHWWSGFYFWAGIVSLLLLGVFEVVSHRYSDRNDELATNEQNETQRRHDKEMARLHREAARLSAEAEASRAQIAEANARTAEAQARLETLRQHIVHRVPDAKAMLPFLKQSRASVEILYDKEDLDATMLARSLRDVLHSAGWDVPALTPLSAAELADRKLSPSWWYLEAHSIPKYGFGSGAYLAFGIRNINGGIHRFGEDTPVDKSPFSLLVAALFRGLGAPGSSTAGPNAALAEGHLRLFILPQSWWMDR